MQQFVVIATGTGPDAALVPFSRPEYRRERSSPGKNFGFGERRGPRPVRPWRDQLPNFAARWTCLAVIPKCRARHSPPRRYGDQAAFLAPSTTQQTVDGQSPADQSDTIRGVHGIIPSAAPFVR